MEEAHFRRSKETEPERREEKVPKGKEPSRQESDTILGLKMNQ